MDSRLLSCGLWIADGIPEVLWIALINTEVLWVAAAAVRCYR